MAVQSRVNWVAQQRVDLNHVLAQESFLAFDFRTLITGLSGVGRPYILRGFEIVGRTGLSVSISVAGSLVFNPLDGNGSFYSGDPNDLNMIVDLPADQENIFVEARFVNETVAPINTAFWDSLALSGDDVAGTEFTASTNTQRIVVLEISANTVGFTSGSIPISRIRTSSSAVVGMRDARDLLFRLGTGGPTPNSLHKFPWSNTREESVAEGTGVGDEITSPFRSNDSTGARNDKAFESLKDWMDAVMTRFSEVSGQSIWYESSATGGAVGGVSISSVFFDTIGHNIQPDPQTSFLWTRQAGDLVLVSNGQATIKWQSNYSNLSWELGGTFSNNTPGGFRTYTNPRFTAPSPVENGNVYLLLERELPKGSGDAVLWRSNAAEPSFTEDRSVSGVSGDFTGIAIGDFIRKESEGFSRYLRVERLSDGVTVYVTEGFIASNAIVAVELSDDILGGIVSEPLIYYRSRYSDLDLFADQVPGVYSNQDISFYWLGRRLNDLFYLRDYGAMQEGEEVTVINDSFVANGGGSGDLILEHAYGAVFEPITNGYSLETEGANPLLTIHRRKRDNTVKTPGAGDNSGAYLTYTIDAPVGLLVPGEALWVKLNDNSSGALVAGSVALNTTDDTENTDVITNVWEILPEDETPLRNYDNRDVYLVARCVSVVSPVNTNVLVFHDGLVMSQYGHQINNRFSTTGVTRLWHDDIHLMARPAESVLFIDQNDPGRIDDDVANFFFDKDNGVHGVFNNRWSLNTLTLNTPADQDWLPNLGQHVLALGSPESTVRIRGNLEVLGATVSAQVATVQSDDKLITLGIGNTLNNSGGSGIEIADNTVEVESADSLIGDDHVDLTYSAAHGYMLGQYIGVSANTEVGGITSGQITGEYVIVGVASFPGQAEILSATELRVYTLGTATATESLVLSPPTESIRTFDVQTWMKVTNSSGSVGDMTSWSWQVKPTSQIVSMTPIVNYGTLATSHTVNMIEDRIPFVGSDAAGPGGADTTLNYDSDFIWDNSAKEFRLNGDIIPQTDDSFTIGTVSNRWQRLQLGSSGLRISQGNLITDDSITLDYTGGNAVLESSSASDDLIVRSARHVDLESGIGLVARARSTGSFSLPARVEPAGGINSDFYYDSGVRKLRFHDGIDWRSTDHAEATGEVTGHEDRTDSTFSFDDMTRTFTLTPTPEYDFYIRGTRFRADAPKTIVIPDVTGSYFIYLDSIGDLGFVTSFTSFLLSDVAYTAVVYWNAVIQEAVIIGDERHGITMDGATHAYLHVNEGTRYVSGLPIAVIDSDNTGASDSQAQFDMSGGTIQDEDLVHNIIHSAAPSAFFEQELTPIAQIPVMYRSGVDGAWVKDTATNFPLKAGTLRPQWNEFTGGSWQTTDATANGIHLIMWVYATNSVADPIVALMGQDEYLSIDDAQTRGTPDVLSLTGMPFQEFKLLYRVVFETDSTFANTIKATSKSIDDFRKTPDSPITGAATPVSHGNLTGLTVDDHPQYLNINGRPGGQLARGGTQAGQNLDLLSTSNVTKGQVRVTETTDAVDTTSGAFRVFGGASVGLSLHVGDRLRAHNASIRFGFRLEGAITYTGNATLDWDYPVNLIDTSAAVSDITLTLQPSDSTNSGAIMYLKDVGGQVSLLGKRVFLRPASGESLISDEVNTFALPLLLDIDYFGVTLLSLGDGRWIIV